MASEHLITVKLPVVEFFQIVNALQDSCGCEQCKVNAATLHNEFRLNFDETGHYKGR